MEGHTIIDNIFLMQEAMAWTKENNQDLAQFFVDFEKMFDHVDYGFFFLALVAFNFNLDLMGVYILLKNNFISLSEWISRGHISIIPYGKV
jgi:hypothetical protein